MVILLTSKLSLELDKREATLFLGFESEFWLLVELFVFIVIVTSALAKSEKYPDTLFVS